MVLSSAREIAFDILKSVSDGEYASDLLRARTAGLRSHDAGLASELVFGVLRFQAQLDYLISLFSSREPGRMDLEVRIALRMGVYQLRYLDRIPPHAAVAESVELVKRARKRSASGLVNAVLRKVNRQPVSWPDPSVALSHPAWLLESWGRQFGPASAAGIASEFLKPPQVYLRVPQNREKEASGLDLACTGVTGCYRLLGGEAPGFRRQDIGSQTVVPILGLQPGMQFLDLCAAPGNKTAQALESAVFAVAADISFRRLRAMNLPDVATVQLDGRRELPFGRRFDRILVDAPCSGTGTIGRNPEIKWRVQPEDLSGFHARQVQLLRQALPALEAGGRVVYATCSLERAENEDVVEEVLRSEQACLVETVRRIPGREPGDGFFAAVMETPRTGR